MNTKNIGATALKKKKQREEKPVKYTLYRIS
jgi:hypothetical protein